MAGVISLNIGSSNSVKFNSNIQKMTILLDLLADQSVYTHSVVVCDVTSTSLICQTYKAGIWLPLNLNNLVTWSWPEDISIKQIVINGIEATNNVKLRFRPEGDLDQMSLLITDGVHQTWIDGDTGGNFTIHN